MVRQTLSPITRRRFMAAAGSSLAGLALAPVGRRTVLAARSTQSPAKGGTITFAYIAKPTSLDPNIWSGTSDNQVVMRQIFDSLVYSPAPGKFAPWLASSWQISSDGRVYTLKLRQDVTFHDGTPLNAAAVKFTYDRMADPANRSLQIGYLGPYDHVEVIDEYTAAIHLKQPFAPFMASLCAVALAPASSVAVKKYGSNYSQHPIGTGPFMFDSWQGNDLHLVRNPKYNWPAQGMSHSGPAYLDRLIYKNVPEAATRMVTLQTGEANVTHYPVLNEVASMKDQGYQVFQVNTPGLPWCFPLNVQRAPTDDLRVRQALNYGVSRQQVVDLVKANSANVASGPLTRPTLYYDPAMETYYPYDLKKAGSLLDEAGWTMGKNGVRQKNGQPLTLEMIMFDSADYKPTAELAQAMIQKLGFQATLDVTAYDAFADRVLKGTYNTAEMNWTALDPDSSISNVFSSKQITGGAQFNRSRYADPHMDQLIDQAERSADSAQRKQIYAQIQKIIMDNALIVPVYDQSWLTLATKEVEGLRFDQLAAPLFYEVWVK